MTPTLEKISTEAWRKAYEDAPGEGIDNYRRNLAWEFFAKMVVSECISQIVKVSDRHTDQYIDAALRDAVCEIEEHFGL